MVNKLNSIRPGKPWLDMDGKPIQAHGGSVIAIGDTYYWYGENKEKTTGKDNIWHWGVRCYSSKDLYNWKNEGIIIPPVTEDPASPLHPASLMDRPHIVYNKNTGKYVAWLKIMAEPSFFAVLAADNILGPYTMVNAHVNPCGLQVGDFDIQVDSATGKAYLFSEKPHTALYCAELNEEYTDAVGTYSEHFPHPNPPESREGPACFVRNGLHYILTSGTTGYFPNPTEAAIADNWHGPYRVLGNPHVNDTSRTSFNSQISCVFRHPQKNDLYIALADTWMPDLPEEEGDAFYRGQTYERVSSAFRKVFEPGATFEFTDDIIKSMKIDSSKSTYTWLPLLFDGENVRIVWRDEWRIEEFD